MDAGAFTEQNAGDHGAVVPPPATLRRIRRQERGEEFPLRIGEFKSSGHSVPINNRDAMHHPAS
ncbi:hypothetical protein GCM10009827_120570 [Dactylosporangium maewongense]|uniref:Uncharacterized protein n=1 Tax=Dactylosporangium maewongense TaxID=634393 RepID=A0ABP4PFA5_9ACTN